MICEESHILSLEPTSDINLDWEIMAAESTHDTGAFDDPRPGVEHSV